VTFLAVNRSLIINIMKHKLYIALLATLLIIPWLGLKQFHSRGEAREALVAQSMALSSNYILPESYSGLVPSKPPMLHWLINISAKVTGDLNEFAVRFPVAFASIIFVFYFTLYLQSLGKNIYLIAPLILITSVQWFRHSNTSRVDMLLSVGSVIAILDLYKWRTINLCKGIPWLSLFGLVTAVYSKGPVGLVLPMGVFSLWSLIEKDSIKKVFIRSVLISTPVILIGTIWYFLAYQQAGQAFIDKFWYENAQRLAGTMSDEPHKGTIFYLYASIFWSMLPWSLFWIQPIYLWLKSASRIDALKNKLRIIWSSSSFDRYLIIWILIFVLFYSIPESKRDVYLLPIMPAISILISNYLLNSSAIKLKNIAYIFNFLLLFLIGVIVILTTLVIFAPNYHQLFLHVDKHFLPAIAYYISSHYWVLGVLAVVLAVAYRLFTLLDASAEQKLISKVIVQFILVLIIVQAIFTPAIGNSISYKNFAVESKDYVVNDQKLYSYNDAFYGLSFYLQKKFYEIDADQNQNIDIGKYYLFENNFDALQKALKAGQCLRTLMRSTKPMVDPKRFVLLLEVYNCGN
jgi:4-amino-4-deoxy-L-arabinose transferase-like glycosyltransferase